MRPLQRVLWSEGLLMGPQHLQQQDLYHEGRLEARVSAIQPHSFGVVSMALDDEALAHGELQLLHFTGVLPEGTPVALERGHPESPAARPVEAHFPASVRVLEVYLALPKERMLEEGQVAPEVARTTPVVRPVTDLASASSVSQVAFGKRNFALLFGPENREDFDAIKIAELARDKTGVLKRVDGYLPPSLRVGASPWIVSELRALLKTLLAKQRDLSATRQQRDGSSVEFNAHDVTRFLQLHALNGILPVVNHLVDTADLHPHAAYLWLSHCAGQLFTFAAQGDPSSLPAFQFQNLRATFSDLFARLNELLRPIALELCITLPLEVTAEGLYEARLEDERLARCSQVVLTVKSDLAERVVADQFPKRAKVSSREEIQGLVQSAIPGVPVAVTFRPPPEVPVRPGVVYFTLGTQDDHWKSALRERSFALYLPQPFEPSTTQIALVAVPAAK